MFSVFIVPAVKNDIQQISTWYNEHRNGLGDDFLISLHHVIDLLRRQPYAFRIRYESMRIIQITKRFPYLVHYFIKEDQKQVVIIGIFHAKQNPDHLRDQGVH